MPGVYDVPEIVWSTSGELKLELLSTWMRYDVAPLTLPQPNVGVLSLIVIPFDGVESGGTEGAGRIVKLQLADHAPVPHELDACTRQ